MPSPRTKTNQGLLISVETRTWDGTQGQPFIVDDIQSLFGVKVLPILDLCFSSDDQSSDFKSVPATPSDKKCRMHRDSDKLMEQPWQIH